MLSEDDQSPAEPPSFWDSLAPLGHYAVLFSERAHADTGGRKGQERQQDMLFRLHRSSPRTATSTLKIVDFVMSATIAPFCV